MKTKQLSKNLIIFATMIMSIFVLSACGKKDPVEESGFKPIELTVEQVQTVCDNALLTVKQAENIYTELGEEGLYAFANAEGYYEKYKYYSEIPTEAWYVYDNSSWIGYTYRENASGDVDLARKRPVTGGKNQATNYIEAYVYDYVISYFQQVDGLEHTLVKTGTQTAENVYELSFLYSDIEGLDGYTMEVKLNIVDGYIKNLKFIVTESGQADTEEYNFLYNVNDVEIPERPNVSWSN